MPNALVSRFSTTASDARLRTALDDDGHVLDVRGELDVATVPQFDAAVRLLLSSSRDCVHLRMTDVTFIDSSGLGALLRAHRAARTRGIDFVIQDPSERVRSLLALTALDATLHLESAAA